MSELRECPFCGGEVTMEYAVADHYIDCPTCQRRHWEEDAGMKNAGRDGLIRWWNTRFERTCEKVPGKMHYGERRPKCSECGYGLGDPRWTYCPSCGAKVIDLSTAIEDAIGEVIERYPNTMDMLGDE